MKKILICFAVILVLVLPARRVEAQFVLLEDIWDGAVELVDDFFEGVGAIPGMLYAAGKLYVQGPYGFTEALLQGKVVTEVTNVMVRNRNPTEEEYAFALSVFGNTLPQRDHILLTNMTGLGGRAFVSVDKIVGGHYLINIGDGYDQPMQYVPSDSSSYRTPGQVYIHEMTHVWQLYQASFQPEQVFKGIYTQIAEGNAAYRYTCGGNWDDYNPEQQGTIVDRYFARDGACEYRYVVENVRKGRLTPRHASAGGTAASVSRTPRRMEMWWIEKDGSVQNTYWAEGGEWKRNVLDRPGSAAPNGGIAAVSRIPTAMEVWWIGGDGSVQDAYLYEGNSWQRFPIAPAGSAALEGGITALSRFPQAMEVWWIGADSSVQDVFWYEGGQWGGFPIAPAGSASAKGSIASLSRFPQTMELWWIGTDGSIQGAYWYEGGTWQRHVIAPAGSASLKSGLAAVSRFPQHMEVFWVSPAGAVKHAFWYEGTSWSLGEIAPPGSAAPTSPVAGVSRIPNSMEIWWVSPNGKLMDAYWYEGNAWQRFEPRPDVSASQNGGLTAMSRVPWSMEVWTNGTVQHGDGSWHNATDGFYWYEGGNWETYNVHTDSATPIVPGTPAPVFQIANGMQPAGENCFPTADWSLKFIFQLDSRILLNTPDGQVYGLYFNGNEIGDGHFLEGSAVGGNGDEQWVFASGNRIFVVKDNGDLYAHEVNGRTIGAPYLMQGDKVQWVDVGNRMQRSVLRPFRFLASAGDRLYGIAPDGTVHGFAIVGNELRTVDMTGSKVAWGADDRIVFALDDLMYVVKNSGEVWGHRIVGNRIEAGFKFGGSNVAWDVADDKFVFPFADRSQNKIVVVKESCGVWMHDAPTRPLVK